VNGIGGDLGIKKRGGEKHRGPVRSIAILLSRTGCRRKKRDKSQAEELLGVLRKREKGGGMRPEYTQPTHSGASSGVGIGNNHGSQIKSGETSKTRTKGGSRRVGGEKGTLCITWMNKLGALNHVPGKASTGCGKGGGGKKKKKKKKRKKEKKKEILHIPKRGVINP